MALQPRRIFIDVQNRTFVGSPSSSLPSATTTWVREDVEVIEIYALRPGGLGANPYNFVDLSAATVKFAVGTVSPAALQTSFTALPTAVTVTNTEVQEGGTFGGTIDEEQKLTWSGAIPVEGSYALSFPYRQVSYQSTSGSVIYQAANHGLYDRNIVTISNTDYQVINSGQNSFSIANIGSSTAITAGSTGTFTLDVPSITTPPISAAAGIAEFQSAIVAAGFSINGIPQIIASGVVGEEVTIRFSGRSGRRSYSPVLVINSSLKGAPGVTANINYNTSEIAALIAAGTTAVTMEVEISEGAVRQTFRQGATLSGDLITSTSTSPLPAVTANSFALQSANGTVFTITVTNSGELMIAS